MPSTPTQARHRHTTRLLTELDREWIRLRHRPATIRRVRRWSGDDSFERVTRSVGSLDDLVAATQPMDPATSASCDAILGRLVELARTDELAGRIVLQRMLPGLISRSRRWRRHAPGGDPTDVAIGAAWIAIRRFDVDRRRRHVAPALIADALWVGFRRDTRRMATTAEVPVPETMMCDHAAPTTPTDPMVALAATLRAADRAGVRASDLAVIRNIAAAGGPTRAATECRVTVRTIRNRRDAATRRIRRALGPDWDDWSDPLAVA
ncbi:hypothetical protein [Ilumatobacter nonamiensis]|uniref:hypothetical protein n=1 Tax=Ilumatobacter nonamiensis TaxID=467093 RepID=UPI0005902087|nr:hypothetical protein [Ilumatobacter nonamiensis]